MSQKPGRNVTQAGPKCHTRAKMSHSHVIIRSHNHRADNTNQWVPMHGPLTRYVKLRAAHAPGKPGTFSPPPRLSDFDMHQGTCMTRVP